MPITLSGSGYFFAKIPSKFANAPGVSASAATLQISAPAACARRMDCSNFAVLGME